MELTDAEFWDKYWAGCKLPSVVDMGFSFERCLATALKKVLSGKRGEVLEIGCAPGRWLAFLAVEIGLKPSGIDYSSAGMDITKHNFAMLGIEYGFIKNGDFFHLVPEKRFDVVMSLGFIEHFTNADEVIGRHLQWLKPGGVLVIGVPNFRGIYAPIQKALDSTVLDKHNLDVMSTEYFKKIAGTLDLKIASLEYIGSFEPALPIAQTGDARPLQFLIKSFLQVSRSIRRFRFLDRVNSRFFSSYILAAFEKKASL